MILRKWIAVCGLLFFSLTGHSFATDHASGIEFTADEASFIQQHPTIKVANEMDWPPFDYNEFGEPKGFSIDYIRLVAQKAGLQIEFVNGYRWDELLQQLKQKQIDVIPALYRNRQREAFILYTQPYYKGKLGVFTHKEGVKVSRNADLLGKRVGIQKAHGAIPLIKKLVPGIQFFTHPENEVLLRMLGTQKLDAIIGNPLLFEHFSRENQITQLRLSHYIEMSAEEQLKTSLHVGVRNDYPLLHQILSKAMNAVTDAEMVSIKSKWGSVPALTDSNKTILLTSKERAYLRQKGPIKICVDPKWMPYERISDGLHEGMSADYFKLFSERVGVQVILHVTHSWSETLSAAFARQCDLISLAKPTDKRRRHLDFTSPYLSFPYVIATRSDQFFIDDIRQKLDETFAVVRGYAVVTELRQKYPQMKLLEVESIVEGLKKVRTGEAFGYIGATAVLSHALQREGILGIKVAGRLPWGFELGVATRNDEPLLHDIFQKAIDTLTHKEQERIQNKWIAANVQRVVDYTLLWQILAGMAVILLLFSYWNRKLTQAKRKIEQANQARGEFLATVNHEIRTPLNAILGMAEVLGDLDLPEKGKRQVKTIKRASAHLSSLIGDVLDFSKIDIGDINLEERRFSLDALVEDTIGMLRESASSKRLELDFSIDPALPDFYWGDDGRVRQILINILSNAIKFTDEGRVGLSVEPAPGRTGVCIQVSDTGRGIPTNLIDTVFEPFHQIEERGINTEKGLGLGLAITSRLVERMEGTINVTSTPGKGSVFTVFLPLPVSETGSVGSLAEIQDSEPVREAFSFPPSRLLVVEDSDLNQDVIHEFLESLPLDLVFCKNGRDAVEAVMNKEFDAVLMDIQMPVMDGVEAVRHIRAWEQENARTPIPVVLQSADTRPDIREHALSAGATDFLAKPFSRDTLRTTITRYLQSTPSEAPSDLPVECPPELASLLPRFFTKMLEAIAESEKAIEECNQEELARQVHTMKGFCGTFGFESLSDISQEIEELVRSQDIPMTEVTSRLMIIKAAIDDAESKHRHEA